MALNGVPPNGELWKIGRQWWVVYSVPDTNPPVPLAWKVEKAEDAKALAGGTPTATRTFGSMQEASATGLLDMGTRAELSEFNDDPFETFVADYEEQARALPMLQDPEVRALHAAALLEGRAPTPEELTQTDWWQSRTNAEREWATLALQDPKEAKQRRADRRRTVVQMLRAAGVSEAPDRLVDLLADKWTTGRWSESMVTNQVLGLSDPYAGIDLSGEVIAAARDYDPTAGDAAALAAGPEGIRERVRAIFESPMRRVAIGTDTEDEDVRLDRIVQEVLDGRDIDDVRQSVDQQAGLHPLTGRDVTRQGEDTVRALTARWLGPTMGNWSDARVRQWAGRMRNDPDAETELVELLKQQRLALLPRYENENLTYEDIVAPVRQLATSIWQQPMQDETLLMDLANMDDYTAMAARLRKEGLKRNIAGVTQSVASDINQITGGSVRNSMV